MAEVRQAFRALLRAVDRHITKVGANTEFREYVIAMFRVAGEGTSQPEQVAKRVALARDYTFLVDSVHHHRELLQSYNIAVDRRNEQAEMLRNTAHRVGLRLPETWTDGVASNDTSR
eukprot:SM004672S16627  [mRNA]  locus=s4672:224:746:- [translate_table: standard]